MATERTRKKAAGFRRKKANQPQLEVEASLVAEVLQNATAKTQDAGARFADAYVLADGSVHEYGGQYRTWASEAEYHRQRGCMAGALFFPARRQPEGETGAF